MSNITITSAFQAIADAIRAKTGKSDTMTPAEMPTEIANISGGGADSLKVNMIKTRVELLNFGDLLVYGEQSTAHYVGVNSFNLTTYADYSNYLSYDTTTNKFTVLADFTGVFRCWVENYQSSGTAPRGKLFYNDTEVLYWEASGTTQGATGGNVVKIDCSVGDTFYVTTPTDNGWAKQYIKVYKED